MHFWKRRGRIESGKLAMRRNHMTTKTLLLAGILCLALVAAIAVNPGDVSAQEPSTGTQLGSKEWDKEQLPNVWEMGAGVGSIFVMYAVVKWL